MKTNGWSKAAVGQDLFLQGSLSGLNAACGRSNSNPTDVHTVCDSNRQGWQHFSAVILVHHWLPLVFWTMTEMPSWMSQVGTRHILYYEIFSTWFVVSRIELNIYPVVSLIQMLKQCQLLNNGTDYSWVKSAQPQNASIWERKGRRRASAHLHFVSLKCSRKITQSPNPKCLVSNMCLMWYRAVAFLHRTQAL